MRGGLRSLVPDRFPQILLALMLAAGMARGQVATTRPVAQPDPPFPVVALFQPVRNLDVLKAMGVNIVTGPEVENAGSMKPIDLAVARDAWLKATADRGLKVILKNPPPTLPAARRGADDQQRRTQREGDSPCRPESRI
jgi:hypothetical protein